MEVGSREREEVCQQVTGQDLERGQQSEGLESQAGTWEQAGSKPSPLSWARSSPSPSKGQT